MIIKILETESSFLGKKVIQVTNIDGSQDFEETIENLRKKYKEGLAYCVVDSQEIQSIHELECLDFKFIEFRIHSWLRIGDKPVNSNIFPYRLDPVGDAQHLEQIKEILLSKQPDDRYFNDYLLDNEFAHKRELFNIEKSYNSWPKEFVLGLFNTQTSKLVGFRSGAFKNEREVIFYLYGVDEAFDEGQISNILDHNSINFLFNMGARIVHSISTGFNTTELNRLILHHGFKIEKSEVVLRRLF